MVDDETGGWPMGLEEVEEIKNDGLKEAKSLRRACQMDLVYRDHGPLRHEEDTDTGNDWPMATGLNVGDQMGWS
jgi:hypothetical protein